MEPAFRNRTVGTEAHLALTDELLETEFSSIAEERFSLIGKLRSKEITAEQYAQADTELRTKGVVAIQERLAGAQSKFDEMVLNGQFLNRGQNAIEVYNKVFGPFSKMMSDGLIADSTGNRSGAAMEIESKDLVKIWNAAGIVTTGDSASEELYTDLQVFYVEQPISLLNIIPKVALTQMDIREFREDSTKVEGAPASRGEGIILPLEDFGTKNVDRSLKSVGARVEYNIEIERDDNRRHFMPYLQTRVMEKHMLKVENMTLLGTGAGTNPTGIVIETGILTPDAIATGAWDFAKVNAFSTVIQSILANAYKPPTHIILNPVTYYQLLTVGSATHGWFLRAPVSTNAPIGNSLPTLFGVPVVMAWTLPSSKFVVMDMSHTRLYTNGGTINRQMGTIGDQFAKLQRTIIAYCWMQQFSRFPNRIAYGTKTA